MCMPDKMALHKKHLKEILEVFCFIILRIRQPWSPESH